MQVLVLSSGGWEVFQPLFCNCRVCQKAIEDPFSKDFRTRPGFLVETKEGKFMIEISPDIKWQAARFGIN